MKADLMEEHRKDLAALQQLERFIPATMNMRTPLGENVTAEIRLTGPVELVHLVWLKEYINLVIDQYQSANGTRIDMAMNAQDEATP